MKRAAVSLAFSYALSYLVFISMATLAYSASTRPHLYLYSATLYIEYTLFFSELSLLLSRSFK
jgi:hypothetical protein